VYSSIILRILSIIVIAYIYMSHASPFFDDISSKQRREWNRGPISDYFPRVPPHALERILDICLAKDAIYNLSESKQYWNARRFTSIVVAHVRHTYSDYDRLLREEHLERYEARKVTAARVWNVLREWCPWDESNPVLERCWKATLLSPEERDPSWDPMDVDSDESDVEYVDDPMDLD
jgi:hypothetical protein